MFSEIRDKVEKLEQPQPHSIGTSLALHLLPGVANLLFIVIVLTYFWPETLPGVLAFAALANLFCLIPIQLGILFFLAKKRGNKGWSLEGVVCYSKSLSIRKYLLWIPTILLCTFFIFSVLQPLGIALEPYFSAINISDQISYEGDFSHTVIIVAMVFNIIGTAILVPITEELYFRGYLLPRMPKEFGKAGPVAHSFLFAVYHLDSPWLVPVRTLGLLPLIIVTRKLQSVKPAIWSHSMVNLYEVIARATDALD